MDFDSKYARAMQLFPYRKNGRANPNTQQIDIIKRIIALKTKSGIIINASTGSGKTAATLTSFMAGDLKGKKILVFVRTITQMDPIIREWSRIIGGYDGLRDKSNPRILPIKGKGKLCRVMQTVPEIHRKVSTAAVGQLCKLYGKKGCNLWPEHHEYSKPSSHSVMLEEVNRKLAGIVSQGSKSPITELDSFYKSKQSCGYYDQEAMMKYARIIIVTYAHMRTPQLMKLTKLMGTKTSNLLILIDEAHNLSKKNEIIVTVDDLIRIKNLVGTTPLIRKLLRLSDGQSYMKAKDVASETEWSNTHYMLSDPYHKDLQMMNLQKWDLAIPEVINFQSFIMNRDQGVIYIRNGEIKLIEATPASKLDYLRGADTLVFQSGTIKPIRDYKSLFGLQHLEELETSPSETMKFMSYVRCRGLTSKMSRRGDRQFEAMVRTIIELHGVSPRHTLVIAPSYAFKEELSRLLVDRVEMVEETKESTIKELSQEITYSETKKIILGVSGGKISEGVELVRDGHSLISLVLLAGMSFRPPSNERVVLQKEMQAATKNKKSARNFEQLIPVKQDIEQAFGRSIRSDHDRGALVILDYRAEKMQKDLKLRRYISITKLLDDLGGFFEGYSGLDLG